MKNSFIKIASCAMFGIAICFSSCEDNNELINQIGNLERQIALQNSLNELNNDSVDIDSLLMKIENLETNIYLIMIIPIIKMSLNL